MQFNYFHKMIYFRPLKNWRVVRVAEGARLESVYMPKVYRVRISHSPPKNQSENENEELQLSIEFSL